jgi:glycosyltransferase involved in cell wall biosynthesis
MPMRFLLAGGAPQAGPAGRWGGHSWHPAWQFHDYIRQRGGESLPEIDTRKVDAFVDESIAYDGVFCESRMAVMLAHEWQRRSLAPRVVLALQVHSLDPVLAVRRWYQHTASVDPWSAALATPAISWLAPTSRQRDLLLEAGVASERVHRLHIGASIFSLLTSDVDVGARAPSHPRAAVYDGAVVFPGNGRRDWATVLRAALGLADLPCVVVGGKRQVLERHLGSWQAPWPANLSHVESVPFGEFVDIVRRARVVVVPLLAGDGDGGHTTVVLANRLGVPVVCTDSSTLSEYGESERTCLKAGPGDGQGLAAAIRRAWTDEALRDRLVREGQEFERELDRLFNDDLGRAIDRAARDVRGA